MLSEDMLVRKKNSVGIIMRLSGIITIILVLIGLLNIVFEENNTKNHEKMDVYRQTGSNQEIINKEVLSTPKSVDERIFKAAWAGDDKRIEKLVREGVAVNQQNKDGETPLHVAVSNGKKTPKVVVALLKAGANINAQDGLGSTPLLYSMHRDGSIEYAKILLDNGADVKLARNDGTTALHWAVEALYFDIIESLLSKGADPNALDDESESPLMWAVRLNRNVKFVKILIESGANIHLANNKKKTALVIAEENLKNAGNENVVNNIREIIKELKKSGATS